MRHCPDCKVDFTGNLSRCPLCGEVLSGEASDSPFPPILLQHKSHRVRILLGALTLIFLFIVLILGLVLKTTPGLILAGVLIIAINYLFVHTILAHSPDFIRALQRYIIVLVLMAFLGWLGLGTDLFPSFVIPITCLIGSTFDLVLLEIFRTKLITDYAKYVFLAVVTGFLPLIIVFTHSAQHLALSFLSIFTSLVLLLVLLVSWRKEILSELHRLFNLS